MRVKKEEVEVKKEPQSAAEVAPGAVKREEAVKEAVQQLQREADAKASAKKQVRSLSAGLMWLLITSCTIINQCLSSDALRAFAAAVEAGGVVHTVWTCQLHQPCQQVHSTKLCRRA